MSSGGLEVSLSIKGINEKKLDPFTISCIMDIPAMNKYINMINKHSHLNIEKKNFSYPLV